MHAIQSLENFLTYLRLHKGRSIRTLEQYEFHLWRFFVYLAPAIVSEKDGKEQPLWDHRDVFLGKLQANRAENASIRSRLKQTILLEVESITKEDIDHFRLDLAQNDLSTKTINAHIITLRSWLKYLKKEGVHCVDPTMLDLFRPPEREVTFLSDEEIVRFFSVFEKDTLRGKRDYAICQCIYSTGLRISELTSLDRKDVDLERMEFAVRGKGEKLRVVYLTETARDAIGAYLYSRSDPFAPLFIRHNYRGEDIRSIDEDDESMRLSRFFITNMVKSRGLRAGILKNLHAHTLRHSFATTLLTNGADIRIIQELLGHASITTTQIYTHVTNPKLKEAHKKYHP